MMTNLWRFLWGTWAFYVIGTAKYQEMESGQRLSNDDCLATLILAALPYLIGRAVESVRACRAEPE